MMTEKEEREVILKGAQTHAVAEAFKEVMEEHKSEIIKRAVAKLTAQGFPVNEEDLREKIK